MIPWKNPRTLSNPSKELNFFEQKMLREIYLQAKTVYLGTDPETQDIFGAGEVFDRRQDSTIMTAAMEFAARRGICMIVHERKIVCYVEITTQQAHRATGADHGFTAFQQLRKRFKRALFALPDPNFSYKLNLVLKRQLMDDQFIEQIKRQSAERFARSGLMNFFMQGF